MEGPVPKDTFAPVGPASHSPVAQAPMAPCLARLPAFPALLAITALRTLPATVGTHVLQVSTAPEVSAQDRASPAKLPPGGSKGPVGSVHSHNAALCSPLLCGHLEPGEIPSTSELCFSGTKHATQFPCPRGYYNPDPMTHSLDSCLPCPPGHYCGQENLTKPSGPCDAGLVPMWVSITPYSPPYFPHLLHACDQQHYTQSSYWDGGAYNLLRLALIPSEQGLPLPPRLVLCVSGVDCSPL